MNVDELHTVTMISSVFMRWMEPHQMRDAAAEFDYRADEDDEPEGARHFYRAHAKTLRKFADEKEGLPI